MKRQQAIILLLLIAALGYMGYVYWPILASSMARPPRLTPKVVKPSAKKAAAPADATAPGEAATEEVAGDKKEKTKILLVDPFAVRIPLRTNQPDKPQEKEVVTEVEPILEGIWVDSDMKVAFISGQALIEGGKVLGWRVKRITKTQVLLVKGGRRKTLKLEGIQ